MNWANLLSFRKVSQAVRLESRAIWLLRYGLPDVILHFLGGLGDELLLTCVAHELRRREPGIAIWQVSAAAELLRGNTDYSLVLDGRYWDLRHSNLLGHWRRRLAYSETLIPERYELPPREHILAALCRAAGITGRVRLRPWFFQTEAEARAGRYAPEQIAIQCVGTRTHESWMANKGWFRHRFQEVIEGLHRRRPSIHVIQLGSKSDPPLDGVRDLRGATTLREAAAVLSHCGCFIGTSGFLCHLARAVDCRSVVIYGGREHSWQSGYPCNENLERRLACAPCWLWHDCDFDRRCMDDILPDEVVEAAERVLARYGDPLEVDEVVLSRSDAPVPRTYPTVPGSSKIRDLPPFKPTRTAHKRFSA